MKAPAGRPSRSPASPRDEHCTIAIGFGRELNVSRQLLMVQFSDGVGKWRDLEQVQDGEHLVGRESFRRVTSATEFLAAEHLRIFVDGDRISVEEGETLNGVYRKVPARKPVELEVGARFQVGQHAIELQPTEPPSLDDAAISRDQERLRWRPLEPLAYLAFIGPDDRPGIRFPLTKLDGTVIGREGDIALTGDTWASRNHAKVTGRDGRFFLEDLGSTNGTFVKIAGRTPIKAATLRDQAQGDVLLIGSVLVRLIEI